ncbi:MAG: flap endonuclease-1 [Candidatus Aenigmarchaeota archaeon]|nr:flap endonuclease-1 [Candidatus Aenigmarchaeota archaeon]
MGIQLSSLVEGKPLTIQELSNRKIAIDAFNWIYQFLTTIRGYDGEPLKDSQGRITSHLSGLFYRNINLLEAGAKLIYVFDGEPPHFKKKEIERRRELKKEAEIKRQEAIRDNRPEDALKYAKRTAVLDKDMIETAKELLTAMGICVIQAPSEGEAMASYIVKENQAWCIGSQDFDSLLYGATRIARNLSISSKRKYQKTEYTTPEPELLLLSDILESLEINQEQLITLGILIGTDYNIGGVKGLGPVKALKLIKEKKTFEQTMKSVEWPFEISADDIFNFFKHPTIGKYEIEFPKINEEKIRNILSEHEFSQQRIDNGLARLKGEAPKKKTKKNPDIGKQSTLSVFSGK